MLAIVPIKNCVIPFKKIELKVDNINNGKNTIINNTHLDDQAKFIVDLAIKYDIKSTAR